MKATLYSTEGKKKGEIEMPRLFNRKVREDIVKKYLEASKLIQPYSSDPKGGKKHSASGTISHKRHDWKAHYGRGISRIPRKTMWRRGTQFYWIGAEISGTRGGRRAHPPKGIGKEKKINKKEVKIAMESALAATCDKNHVLKRYGTLDKLSVNVPVVIESSLEKSKTKEIIKAIESIFEGKHEDILLKQKSTRAGKGKRRGRKYKSNAGILLIKSAEENIKTKRIQIANIEEVSVNELYPLGRLVIYTEKAIKSLGNESKK